MIRRALSFALAIWLLATPAWATHESAPASNVRPVPAGAKVSVLRPTAVNIKWVFTGLAAAAGERPASNVGLFLLSDPGASSDACSTTSASLIGRNDSSVTALIGANGVARAVETLIIPGTVADRALKLGRSQFFYCRTFTSPSIGTIANRVTCEQGSSAFADFSIGRIELFFENHRREITVPLGYPNLRVFADIAYNGTGILRAIWEHSEATAFSATARSIAQPTTLPADPDVNFGSIKVSPPFFSSPVEPNVIPPATNFRTLNVINQFIGFGDRAILTLPLALPTNQPGEFIVNLRFVQPPVPFDIPLVRYFVEAREHVQRSFGIALQAPGDAAALAFKPFDFRWAPAARVTHYRLDVYPQETVGLPTAPGLIQGPTANPAAGGGVFIRAPRELRPPTDPVVSALIPSGVTAFTLRPNQFVKLAPGRSYLWRVKGLDQLGNVIAESPLRQFVLQAR